MEVLEAINSMRAVRRFSELSVEESKIKTILEVASKAPSGGNSQPWEFVVIRDARVKQALKQIVSEEWEKVMVSVRARYLPPDRRRVYDEATMLAEDTDKISLLILACLNLKRASRTEEVKYSSIYPAVQNLMLAAWELGLGSCLTTHGCIADRGEERVKRLLHLPQEVKPAALIYLGYPRKRPSLPKRIPVEKFVHYDAW